MWNRCSGLAGWHSPVILVLRRQKQKDYCEFEDSLVCMYSRLSRIIYWDVVSKQDKTRAAQLVKCFSWKCESLSSIPQNMFMTKWTWWLVTFMDNPRAGEGEIDRSLGLTGKSPYPQIQKKSHRQREWKERKHSNEECLSHQACVREMRRWTQWLQRIEAVFQVIYACSSLTALSNSLSLYRAFN